MKKTQRKSNHAIASEWNNIAKFRHQQITKENDLSYNYVLIPSILSLIKNEFNSKKNLNILDAGCGTGNLAYQLSKRENSCITGIDISEESIKIAKETYGNSRNISFYSSSIEKFSDNIVNKFKYDLIVSNMTLMDVSNLDNVVKSISSMLKEEGVFVFSITHPVFWSRYWEYENSNWFNYLEEIFIEAPFKTSLDNSEFITSHIHRPLEMYFHSLRNNNLRVTDLIEPMPEREIEEKYPKSWEFPRFMVVKCIK